MNRFIMMGLSFALSALVWAEKPNLPQRLDMEQAMALALRHRPALKQAELQSLIATQQVHEVRASRRPKLSTLGDATYDENDTGFDSGPQNERWNAELRLDVPLTSGGRFTARHDQAEAAAMSSDQTRSSEEARTILLVRQAFLQAVLAGRVVDVQEESLEVLKGQYENSKSRFDAGILSRLPLLQSQVAYENAKPALLRAQQDHRLAIEALRNAIGLNYAPGEGPENIRVETNWPSLASPARSLSAALDLAENQRPELAAIDLQIDAQQAAERFEKRSNMPDLDGYFRYGADNNTFEEGEDVRTGWTLGLTLNWTLIDLGDRKSRIHQARFQQEVLALDRKTRWQEIEQELREAWYAKEVSEAILKSADVNVRQAEEALKLSTESLTNGRATQLDVLQAELALTQARLEKHRAEHDRLAALASLLFAVGPTPVR